MKTIPHDWTNLREQELPMIEKIRRQKSSQRFKKNLPEKRKRPEGLFKIVYRRRVVSQPGRLHD